MAGKSIETIDNRNSIIGRIFGPEWLALTVSDGLL